MITVAILINGEVLAVKNAVRIQEPDERTGVAQYRTNCNKVIEHKPKEGAKKLAKKMIDVMDIDIPFQDLPKDKQMEWIIKILQEKVKR